MKKKLLLLIFIVFPFFSYADTWSSSITWNSISWWQGCPSTNSHWIVHYWVPISNSVSAGNAWTISCLTHTYYSSSNHPKSFSYNWWMTSCWAWERVIWWDPATNTMTCQKYDDTPPTRTDITWTNPANWSNLLAINSQNFNVITSAWWEAPITSIKVFFENWNSTDSLLTSSHEYIPSWYNENIQNVDSDRLNWARNYSLQVAKVCDEAWNCIWSDLSSSNLKTFNYNIYSNTTNMWTKSVTTNQLDDWLVADWTNKNLTISLSDIYWNQVVPAPAISRTIDFNFNYNNSLYLNQYNQSWNSAVYTDYCASILSTSWHEFSIWNTIKFCNWENWAGNWTYTYWFQIYTPTQNTYNKAYWNFNMNSITYDVNWSIWNMSSQWINNSNFAFNFNPLYYTNFAWAQKSWFIEWVSQNWTLSITKNTSTATPSIWTYLKFGWNTRDYDILYSKTWNATTPILESSVLSTNYWNSGWWLITKLVQTSSKANTSSDVYLSSHIWYTLNSKDVVYNSDIIWKNNYFDSTYLTQEQANQSQLKVYGLVWTTSSTKLNSFTSNQAWNVMEISWWFDKSVFKWELLAWITKLVNSIPWNTDDTWNPNLITTLWTTIWKQAWKIVWDNKNIILYKTNKLVSLYNWDYYSTPIWISDKKTIVIYGWDLYINRDMYYTNNSSILWIIVMKDSSWKWWNIYISPKVTNIVWSIFASKAVFSATVSNTSQTVDNLAIWNWITYYDWNADADVLKNQLYIYWNLFSANTLGWSKSSPKKCPYYVTSCTADEAIKYDLNFLRRYYLVSYDTDNNWIVDYKCPYAWWKVIWWALTCTSWTLSWFDTSLTKLFTNTSSSDAIYPLVIKYNSTLQTNPPPLFSQN